jgi:D-threo-aldose 1-dehydrogenase
MTHRLGFGCANLYELPARRDRRALLETAYDLGIRHFDVAPMYGLGLAEPELADFLSRHDDAIVATKFGIRLTALGRVAGSVQRPIRLLLQASTATQSRVKVSGTGPDSGAVGQLLYSPKDYSVENAERALASSLRALRRERIDFFFLHEPVGATLKHAPCLADYLDLQIQRGRIGGWGPAGDLSKGHNEIIELTRRASAVQCPYDLIVGHAGPVPDGERSTITFGFVSRALGHVKELLGRRPALREECSDALGADLASDEVILNLIVRDAISHNADGTVLVSSTNPDRLGMVCSAARTPLRNEVAVAAKIRRACLDERSC